MYRMPAQVNNVFDNLPLAINCEVVERLVQTKQHRVERIVSHGQSSEAGFWYDQHEDEWVMVLQGAAKIRFQSSDRILELTPGDAVHIRARERHRVEWTTPDEPTIWLAVFFPSCEPSDP